MSHTLPPQAIDTLLATESIARIACHAGGVTYIVPMTYSYRDGCFECHGPPGLKNRMMRENPDVCVEVERLEGPERWQTVLAWGRYEECADPASDGVAFRIRLSRMTGRGEGR